MQELLISRSHHRQPASGNVHREVIKHRLFWNFPHKCESKPRARECGCSSFFDHKRNMKEKLHKPSALSCCLVSLVLEAVKQTPPIPRPALGPRRRREGASQNPGMLCLGTGPQRSSCLASCDGWFGKQSCALTCERRSHLRQRNCSLLLEVEGGSLLRGMLGSLGTASLGTLSA